MSRLTAWLRKRTKIDWYEMIRDMSARAPDLDTMRMNAGNPLEQIYYGHDDRIASKWHSYLAVYDRHLSDFRNRPVRFLEIGVNRGGSLQVWKRYLGDEANIHGLDIDPRCAGMSEPGIKVHIGSQSDSKLLERIVAEMGGVDIVIDDGSHNAADQIKSFEVLFPKLAAEGIYVCEDLHTSYWEQFGGGLRRSGSFMEYAKNLLDRLNSWYFENHKERSDDRFPYQVRGIFFYDSLVIVEKQPKQAPFYVDVGRRGFEIT